MLDPVEWVSPVTDRKLVRQLLAEVNLPLIRGNAGELGTIAGEDWQAKGVDAGQGKTNLQKSLNVLHNAMTHGVD